MFSRLNRALEAGRQAVSDAVRTDEPVLPGEPSGAAAVPALPPLSLAFLCLETSASDLIALADEHLRVSDKRNFRPLMIVSTPTLIERRIPRLCCEYIPTAADLAEPHGDKPDVVGQYQLRKLRLILRKWRTADCLFHGDEAADLLALAARRKELAIGDVVFQKYGGKAASPRRI